MWDRRRSDLLVRGDEGDLNPSLLRRVRTGPPLCGAPFARVDVDRQWRIKALLLDGALAVAEPKTLGRRACPRVRSAAGPAAALLTPSNADGLPNPTGSSHAARQPPAVVPAARTPAPATTRLVQHAADTTTNSRPDDRHNTPMKSRG
jgi:hypothetical protein